MKLTKLKLFAGVASLALLAGTAFISCNNGNNATEDAVEKSDEESELESVAFNVLGALCNLTQYDENASNDEDSSSGVSTLPDNWKTLTFQCEEGFALDSTDTTVRSVPVLSADDARQFFADVTGVTDEITNTYTWSYTGFGTLTFEMVSETAVDGVYATIGVDVPLIENLTKIELVTKDAITLPENAFTGVPYYSAGDVVQRKSDGTYWICVRPAGGPLNKDKSYWICLSPFDKKGKSIIKTETTTQTTYEASTNKKLTAKWIYAKNLMTLKTAKAAHHTFNAIVNPLVNELTDVTDFSSKVSLDEVSSNKKIYEALKEKGFDLMNLHSASPMKTNVRNDDEQFTKKNGNFNFAYGSPKTDNKRITSGKKKNADVKYVQPFIRGKCVGLNSENNKANELIYTKFIDNTQSYPYMLSVTDTYDDTYCSSPNAIDLISGGKLEAYNYEGFLHRYQNNNLNFVEPDNIWLITLREHVIFSPELMIKDNKGKDKKPNSGYEDIYRSKNQNWWWSSLAKTVRFVDGVEVDWDVENK